MFFFLRGGGGFTLFCLFACGSIPSRLQVALCMARISSFHRAAFATSFFCDAARGVLQIRCVLLILYYAICFFWNMSFDPGVLGTYPRVMATFGWY